MNGHDKIYQLVDEIKTELKKQKLKGISWIDVDGYSFKIWKLADSTMKRKKIGKYLK
jgi:hypothetical protein